MFDVFEELKSQGKILLVITHDLGTALTKCDQLLLLNKQIIANGSLKEVMTADNMQRAYGDSIFILNREVV
jgi:manganese/iron transport system ATP-binding protein